MSHINSIGAVMFTDLAVAMGTNVTVGKAAPIFPTTKDDNAATGYPSLFKTVGGNCTYLRMNNIREFPAFGAQPNLVKVPVFGQTTSATIGAQSDMPDFSVTINYVPSVWSNPTAGVNSTFTVGEPTVVGTEFGKMVGDGIARVWRLTLLTAAPKVTTTATLSHYDSIATGLGTVSNSQFYFEGKLESLQVTPSLSDAAQATLAFSINSAFYGPWTI